MNFLKNYFVLFFVAITFYACSSDDNVEPLLDDLNSNETFFKVKFNGTDFNSTQNIASIANGQLTLISTQGGNSFRIQINNVSERTYNPNEAGVNIEYKPAGSSFAYVGKNTEVASTGLITIRKIDLENKLISATFNFTGYWNNPNEIRSPINFTSGIFNNITYTSTIIPPPTSDQVFSCNFDGQTFNGNEIQAYYFQNDLYIYAGRAPQDDKFLMIIYNAEQNVNYNPNNVGDVYLMYQPANTEYVYWAFHPNDPNAVTGNILISSLDVANLKVSGTFNFEGSWSDMDNPSSKTFSNGIFDNISISLTPPPSNDQFFCKVNNEDFNPSDIQVAEVTFGIETFIAIAGLKNNIRVNVNIHEDLVVGTYPIAATGDAQAAYLSTTPEFSIQATSGTLVIQEKTLTKIKGTFSFIAPSQGGNGPFNISEGTFDVELP